MILDRDTEKNHRKTTTNYNDLCAKLKNLDIKNSDVSESINNFSKMKDKMKNNFEDIIIDKIGEKFNNIKIVDDDKSPTSEKLKNEVVLNIVCDNTNIQDQKICKRDSSVSSDKEEVVSIEKEKPVINVGAKEKILEEKDSQKSVSNSSSIINNEVDKEDKVEFSESEDSKETGQNSEVLCSRGPVPHKISQQQYHPYDNTWTSHGLHSGGKVRVSEPVAQTTVNNYQQFTDIPTLNIIQSGQEQCTPPVQVSYLPVSEGPQNISISDEEAYALLIKELAHNPVIENCCDILSGNNWPNKGAMPGKDTQDEGVPRSPSFYSERSPPSSPDCTFLRPPRSNKSDSGVDSPTHLVDYPGDKCFPEYVDGKDKTERDRTTEWVESTLRKIKVEDLQQYMAVDGRILLPKPIIPSAKTKFQEILKGDLKLRAWVQVQTLNENDLVTGDESDGDTQLMIVVSNKFEGQLEILYALVERMRHIPNSLAIRNKAGQSALYLACKVMPEQPLVAAYIAEALLEQNVDLTSMTYECNLTLPQILENEGSTHDAVRRELLALKDSGGKLVFHSYHRNDVNGNN